MTRLDKARDKAQAKAKISKQKAAGGQKPSQQEKTSEPMKTMKTVKTTKAMKSAKTTKTIEVKLIKSLIGRLPKHRKCVYGLGLRRIGQKVELLDTPSNRGMINKVDYLLELSEEEK